MSDKSFSKFTEQDSIDLGKLPEWEVRAFHEQLASITLQMQIAEDTYIATTDSIWENAEILFDTIKKRLAIFREYGS